MKSIITFLFVSLISFSYGQQSQRFAEKSLIFKISKIAYDQSSFNNIDGTFGLTNLDLLNNSFGAFKIKTIGKPAITRTFLIEFQNSIDVIVVINAYKNLGLLEYAEPNFLAQSGGEKGTSEIIPNDTRFNRQWGMYNDGTMTGIGPVVADADVDLELAWDMQTGDPEMIIAVSDSGLKMNHPDIASRIWTNTAEIAGNGIDDDNNGFIDDVKGWDWRNSDNNPTDDYGHGSNVAGIIGCVANNNSMFVGANWNSKIMVLKVLGADNSATYADMASSIYYAVDEGAKVLSMSLGGGPSNVMSEATAYTDTNNVIFVACMMNFNNSDPYYPAAYSTTHSNVIAVGATNPNDSRTSPFFWSATSGSNFGSHLNVVAPGNYTYNIDYTSDTAVGSYWGGTSQATPLVAGIASLILAQNSLLSPVQVRGILEDTAQDQVGNPTEDVAGFDQYMGFGRVNAFAAIQAATALGVSQTMIEQNQEFKIINPEKNGMLQLFSRGNFPGIYSLIVNSMDGKLLQSENVNLIGGLNTISFDHVKGNYILTLKGDKYSKIFKIVKE